jgi:hypothetical protein
VLNVKSTAKTVERYLFEGTNDACWQVDGLLGREKKKR